MLNNKTNAAALYGNTFIMNVHQTTRELQLQTNVKNAPDVGPRMQHTANMLHVPPPPHARAPSSSRGSTALAASGLVLALGRDDGERFPLRH
jgi:hypothetical protein